MKNIKLIIAFLLFANFVFAKGENPQTIKLKTSAVCGMCKRKIEKNLAFENGIKDVNLDVPSKILTVTFDAKKTNITEIKKLIAETGYDADETVANPQAYDKLSSCCKKDLPVHN